MKFKIKAFILFVGLLFTTELGAQNGDFDWVKQVGGLGDDVVTSITTDGNGNVITTGYFQGTVDFDPGAGTANLTTNGGLDIFIQKLDANGNFIWAKQMVGSGFAFSNEIIVDDFDNVYIIGHFRDTVDFDPGSGVQNLISNGDKDFFIQKLNASGDLLWVKQIGGVGGDEGTSIAIDGGGHIIATGSFRDTVDLDPGVGIMNFSATSFNAIFVQKLDANGNLIWVKQIDGDIRQKSRAVAIDPSGNICINGSFFGTTDFDPGMAVENLTSNGINDIFILKLNTTGDFIWVKQMGGASTDIGTAVATNSDGSIYSTGFFNDTVDFDPNSGTTNLYSNASTSDSYIQKLDINGELLWVKQVGSSGYDHGHAIKVDAIGNVYSLSEFSETINLSPSVGPTSYTSVGARDILIQKLNPNGNLIWVKQFGGADDENATALTVDINNGSIYSTGAFLGTADFNPGSGVSNLSPYGSFDGFVQKLNVGVTGIEEDDNEIGIIVYPNPNNGKFKIVFESEVRDVEISIFSINGQLIEKAIYNNSLTAVNLDILNQSAGIYFVDITTPDWKKTMRVIKN